MLHPESLYVTVPMLLKGMAGIFLVIGSIAAATGILNKLMKK